MLTLLLGTDWKVNKDRILTMVAEDVRSERGGRIFMVPELISHQTERDLSEYAGDTSSRFAEVLSFTRLAKRVAQDCSTRLMECLDNGGRVVAMAAATRQLHSKLKAYAAVETKPEFLLDLLDAVDEFKRCCVTSADLMFASKQTQGNLAQKLEELSLILEAYNAICQRGKRDPRDQMTWLLELLETCDFAQNHTFYFDAFPDFSRQHMDIVEFLICNAPNVVISLHCDTPGSDAMAYEKTGSTAMQLITCAQRNHIAYKIEYISAADSPLKTVCDSLLQGNVAEGVAADCLFVHKTDSLHNECSAALEIIISLIQSGCRYRDISIVCPNIQAYQSTLHTLLNKAHIPYYLSGTEDILEKTVIHTVLTALDAALGGFEQSAVLRYLKSPLSPLPIELCDKLENYAVIWSVDGSRWAQNWENHPKGLGEEWTEWDRTALEQLNSAREQAIMPLVKLREDFSKTIGVRQQVIALYQFLTRIGLDRRLQQLARSMDESGDNRNAQILNQLWEILLGALEQLYDVLAETSWDSDTFTRLLKLLLSQYDVGTIPTVLDAVTIGSVSAMRCHRCKYLFVLGASEGAFPSYGHSAGILNDQERSILQKIGVPLNPGAIDGLQTQFSEISEVFCGACNGIYVFCSDGQPSFIYNRLKKLAGREITATPVLGAALSDPWEAAALLSAAELRQEAAYLGLEKEYCEILRKKAHTLGTIDAENVTALYGDTIWLSASQIDRLAECRLSYFMKYGIKAKERKAARIDPAEFGTYVHAVLEECGRTIVNQGGFRTVTLEQTLSMAADVSARYFAENFAQINSRRLDYHFQKNTGEVMQIVQELWEEMQETQFQAVDFELHFGHDGDLPAIDIPGQTICAQLNGFVDRVDCWETNGKKYIRVVDYKTGKKDFDYCDVFNGIGLQMLLYLYALEDGGEEIFGDTPIISGVQYFPARVPLISADGVLSEEEARLAHSKVFRRKGLLLADEAVLRAMEPADQPKRLNIKRNKDGTVSGDIATSHQFVMLKKYIFKLLRGIVDEIASGNVTANPYTRGSSHSACQYCPYGAVCHPAEVPDRRNYKKMSADRFWEEIEKEVK